MSEPKSFPKRYNDALIIEILYTYKQDHDGHAPTIRQFIELYGDQVGKYASTSVMRTILGCICKANGWTLTNRGIETNGEWRDYHRNS